MPFRTTHCHPTVSATRISPGERAHSVPRVFPSTRTFSDRVSSEYQGRSNESERSNSTTGGSCGSPPPQHPRMPSSMRREPSPSGFTVPEERPVMQILPDTLVTGAVNVASSAINTARSVLNMFAMPPRDDQVRTVCYI